MEKNLEKIVEQGTDMANKIRDFAAQVEVIEKEKLKRDEEIKRLKSEIDAAREEVLIQKKKAEEAEKLKSEVYAPLIHDLFDAPKQELKKSVIEQSKVSGNNSARWAIGSILVSVCAGIYSHYVSIESGKNLNNEIAKINHVVFQFKASSERASDDLRGLSERNLAMFQTLWPEEYVVSGIIELLNDESDNFNQFSSKNDVALFYTQRLIDRFPQSKHEHYISALNKHGNNVYVPSLNDLREWGNNIAAIYHNIQSNEDFSQQSQEVVNSYGVFDKYKLENDSISYEGWGWGEVESSQVAELARFSLDAVLRHIKHNTKEPNKAFKSDS
ncbi:hypothetical protein L1077_20590 [Pseudoalteromonas luteoviolacea]|uniref:hypothetical protein n=1 Tax=Pseudoalteromonas luteoviolacea TaxID=43657 RepID=UPI001F281350|nr:hypothetical protein [Pseudoalteromonas luteoviolacea]MCF6441839.1 hypothetical protein [Pseudoalteromonas luteoviolacea]